jgi:hypothetical protein
MAHFFKKSLVVATLYKVLDQAKDQNHELVRIELTPPEWIEFMESPYHNTYMPTIPPQFYGVEIARQEREACMSKEDRHFASQILYVTGEARYHDWQP